MSLEERTELQALGVWLKTFPQVNQTILDQKENEGAHKVDVLSDKEIASDIFEVSLEICNLQDGGESTLGLCGDLWDNVISMTQKNSKKKRKSLDPPTLDTPHIWDDYVKHAALASLLDGAVTHKDLQMRKTYIERIMGLPPDTQRSLMSLIERKKKKKGKTPKKGRTSVGGSSAQKRAKTTPSQSPLASVGKASPVIQSNEKGGVSDVRSPFYPLAESTRNILPPSSECSVRKSNVLFANSPVGDNREPRSSIGNISSAQKSPIHVGGAALNQSLFSPGLGDSAEYEKEFQELRERNEELEATLQRQEQEKESLGEKLEHMEATSRNEMMKMEAESRRREDQMKEEHESRMTSLLSELGSIKEEVADANRAKVELAGLKDEMELMVHTKSMLEETTERLRTYKEKVQQLSDSKEALKREEDAHSKSVEECLRLENELKTLQPLKRQLEEYQARAVEAEVELAESKEQLTKLQQHRMVSSDNHQNLESAVLSQQQEIEELMIRLKQDSNATTSNTNLGDGISELNPELKEEILRLRNENQLLKEFAAKRENDNVTKLEQDMEDANRLSERYKGQFLATKDQLENERNNLQLSRDREAKLRTDIAEAMEKIKLTQGMVEDVSQQLYHTSENLDSSKEREAKLEAELSRWVDQTKQSQEEANNLSSLLQTRSNEAEAGKARELKLHEELAEWKKELQSSQGKCKELSEKLRDCEDNLKKSQSREVDLLEQLDQTRSEVSSRERKLQELESQLVSSEKQATVLMEDVEQLTAQRDGLVNELQDCREDLKATQGREDALRAEVETLATEKESLEDNVQKLEQQVQMWTVKAGSFEEEAQKLVGELEECTEELKCSRESEVRLSQEIVEVSGRLRLSEQQVDSLTDQLTNVRKDFESTRTTLANSREQEECLLIELADMTTRAEDAEAVSKQRMDLVQSTREKLKVAEGQITTLRETGKQQSAEIISLNTREEEAEQTIQGLTGKLSECNEELHDTRAKLDDSIAQVADLEKKLGDQTGFAEEWKEKTHSADNLTEKLQDELVQMRDMLSMTQTELKASQQTQEIMQEGFIHAEHMMFELEAQVETEIHDREKVEEDLESCRIDIEKMEKELESLGSRLSTSQAETERTKHEHENSVNKLNERINEEVELSNKFKQDLFNTEETLNDIQGSLGASQHREKMLKLEVTQQQDQVVALEAELAKAKGTIEATIEESARSLDATREVLSAKAKKERDEVQENMNMLLEGERTAKRQADEHHKNQVHCMQEEFAQERAALEATSSNLVDEFRKSARESAEKMKQEHEKQLQETKKAAEEDREKLIAKGKGMLKETRAKATEEYDALLTELEQTEDRLDEIKKEKDTLLSEAQSKMKEYKKKIVFATGRINTLSSSTDELEERVKSLEREKFKLSEENDRYRRQLGGRGGADSKLQGQLDLLQKEFKSAMEETKELRRQVKEGSSTSALPMIHEGTDESYSRDAVNQSTLVQLRMEYEETIEALNDEKRELVMRNSAAITDVQKAEKRAWESEQENSELKQDVTSLKLQVGRLEHLSTRLDAASTEEGSLDESQMEICNGNLSEVSSIPPGASEDSGHFPTPPEDEEVGLVSQNGEPCTPVLQTTSTNISSSVGVENSALPILQKPPTPSMMQLHSLKPGEEAPPDCKQS